MIIISQRAADRQTTVMNLLVGLGTRDGSCFWTSVSLPRDPLYSGFLKFPELPEMDKNAAYFGHSNAKTLSALGGEEGSGASPLTSRLVVLPIPLCARHVSTIYGPSWALASPGKRFLPTPFPLPGTWECGDEVYIPPKQSSILSCFLAVIPFSLGYNV